MSFLSDPLCRPIVYDHDRIVDWLDLRRFPLIGSSQAPIVHRAFQITVEQSTSSYLLAGSLDHPEDSISVRVYRSRSSGSTHETHGFRLERRMHRDRRIFRFVVSGNYSLDPSGFWRGPIDLTKSVSNSRRIWSYWSNFSQPALGYPGAGYFVVVHDPLKPVWTSLLDGAGRLVALDSAVSDIQVGLIGPEQRPVTTLGRAEARVLSGGRRVSVFGEAVAALARSPEALWLDAYLPHVPRQQEGVQGMWDLFSACQRTLIGLRVRIGGLPYQPLGWGKGIFQGLAILARI